MPSPADPSSAPVPAPRARLAAPGRPWWDPARHQDRRPLLLARNRIRRRIADWFETGGFTEVDPAALQVSPGNEAHLHAFASSETLPDGTVHPRYLHTSPEFAMKKLLAAGESRIFAFAHVFRNRELGPLHSGEFTMLEWYRSGAPYEALMEDCAALMRIAAREAGLEEGTGRFRWRGADCDPFAEAERLPLAEAVRRYSGIDLMATLDGEGTPSAPALAAAMQGAGLSAAEGNTWSDLLSALLVARVEPQLGMGRPTILDLYPAHEAALARRSPADPRLAERFELYACGVELANGFGELTDPAEQRRRFILEMDEKERVYGHRYPLDEEFLAALALMPPAAGIAMGFDRLVLLATHAPRLSEVMWAPPG